MGSIQPHFPTLAMVAVFSRHPAAMTWGLEKLQTMLGPIALQSEDFDFSETRFYTKEMGEGLRKRLILFEPWYDAGHLAECKLQTNAWEEELAQTGQFPDARPLNLDPGYLTLAKFVLATTKDREHRLYLRDGIYAEQTLFFAHKRWQPRPWTYPDYCRADFHVFFHTARRYLKEKLNREAEQELQIEE